MSGAADQQVSPRSVNLNFKYLLMTHKLLVLNSIFINLNNEKNILLSKVKLKLYNFIQKSIKIIRIKNI